MAGEHTGAGAQLQKGDGASPQNFVAMLGIKSLTPPGISRETAETTDMNTDGWKTFIGALKDGGEVSFEANFLPNEPTQGQAAGGFLAEFDKSSCDSLSTWRMVAPPCDGEPDVYWEFDGIVTGADGEWPLDDVMTFDGTIKVSGRPELVVEQSA